MSVYSVSYYDWESSVHFLLTHDTVVYSMVEFEDICKTVKGIAYGNCLERIREFNRSHSWDRNLTVWDDDLAYEMVKLLKEEYGFRELDCILFDVGLGNCKCTSEL